MYCLDSAPHGRREGQMSICLRRREFIAGLGGAAAWPVLARAQQGDRIRRIGYLTSSDEHASFEVGEVTVPKTAPYGSWKSPITSDLIVAQSIALSEVQLDGGKIQ